VSKQAAVALVVAGALLWPALVTAQTPRVGVTEDKPNKKWGFNPPRLSIAVGDTVEFVNNGAEEHDFVSVTDVFASPVVAPGASFTFTFTRPGEFKYYCTFHEGQEGFIVVGIGGGPPAVGPTAVPTPELSSGDSGGGMSSGY
jgi:plastocyanin